MNKRNLSKLQQRRIKQRQKKRIDDHIDGLGPEEKGLVITHHGRQAEVVDDHKQVFLCQIRQNITITTGDEVLWLKNEKQGNVITARLPRHSILQRPLSHGKIKEVAANIDQIFVVIALTPPASYYMLDSYLISSEQQSMPISIICNKNDLNQLLNISLQTYQNLGYQIYSTSSKTGDGIEALKQALHQHRSILVGQSGVGKSSLLKKLVGDENIITGQLVANSGLGSHTTTQTTLYHLDENSYILDSPGVREFGLWNLTRDEIISGFKELQDYLGHCHFRDCSHQHEKGCAILKAKEQGKIATSRYNSLQQILAKQ